MDIAEPVINAEDILRIGAPDLNGDMVLTC
jgi:hypothetical protein